MTAVASHQAVVARQPVAIRSQAVLLLQLFAATLMIFPAYYDLKAVGGDGYVGALFAYMLFFGWLAVTLFGMHNPFEHRSPVRVALCGMWLVSLASYALMNRGELSSTQLTGADRWLLQLVLISGVILGASEFLRSLDDIHRVLRVLVWAGAFVGVIAALQYWKGIDLTHDLKLPGFSLNQAAGIVTIGSRGGHSRVTGTASDPIELGVAAGMLLPLAVYLAVHDLDRSRWKRFIPVLLIAIAIPTSVSRAAILAAVIGVGVLVIAMPPAKRVTGFAAFPIAVAAIFVTAHGIIGTLQQFFLAGTSDASIAHRVGEYPYVEATVRLAPWFGQGGGTYIVTEVHILDNQYLTSAIELGLVGTAALAFYLIWPALAALKARGRSADPQLRDLCAALAGAELAAVVCSYTFDSMSFPMFVGVQALVVGLIGAAWLLVQSEREAVAEVAEADGRRRMNGPLNRYLRARREAVGSPGGI
jgi:O-antigen ligase